MARKKVKIVDLNAAINELLEEYGNEVFEVLEESIDEVGKDAARELRGVNRFSPQGHPSGEYAAGWTYDRFPKGRLSTEGVVYNEDKYRLAHLLEKSHALRNGGRSTAYKHIEPVNDDVQERIVKVVKEKLS